MEVVSVRYFFIAVYHFPERKKPSPLFLLSGRGLYTPYHNGPKSSASSTKVHPGGVHGSQDPGVPDPHRALHGVLLVGHRLGPDGGRLADLGILRDLGERGMAEGGKAEPVAVATISSPRR